VAGIGLADAGSMTTSRRIAAAFFGTAAGLFLGRALFKWILDLHGAWEWAPIVAFALVGCVLGVVSDLAPHPPRSAGPRDASA
jgi:apolipoprotein N-acyltransferase